MADTILEMRNITKRFPGVKALDGVNFSVERGEIHCLVGENGAGKSTLMKVLSGVHPYGSYEGDVIVKGDVQQFHNIADSEKKGIAIIYQELALIPELSIYENIFFGHEKMKGSRIDWNETIVEAEKLMKRVGLKLESSTKIRNMGVGQQQLVEIAKALGKNAEIIIFDEPTNGLDVIAARDVEEFLINLKKENKIIIISTHIFSLVEKLCDHVGIIISGKLVKDAPLKEIQKEGTLEEVFFKLYEEANVNA